MGLALPRPTDSCSQVRRPAFHRPRDETALPSAACAPAILHTLWLRRDLRTPAIPAAIEFRQTSFGTPRGCLRAPKTSDAGRLPLLSRPRLRRSRGNGFRSLQLAQTAENRDSSHCSYLSRIHSSRLHARQIRYPSQTRHRECCPVLLFLFPPLVQPSPT